MKLIDAPVGVFVFRDEFVLKTEYMTNIDGVYIPDCYILSTGEKFWGGMKSKEDFKTKYNNLDVEVIDIMPSAHLESKRQATVSSDLINLQRTIDVIKDADVFVFYDEDTKVDDAIEIAIRATKGSIITGIKSLPSAESVKAYTKADYIMALHKEYGCTLTMAEEAHNKALEYLRSKARMKG